jgi:hypothetical protein
MEVIRDTIIDKDSFERIRDLRGESRFGFSSYEEFMAWNERCINEMSGDDFVWINGLSRRMRRNAIGLMDLEPCVIFNAFRFFFARNKDIVIVNDR